MRWLYGITDSMDNEFEQIQGDSEGQGSLACCTPWDCKEFEMTKQLNNNNMTLMSKTLSFNKTFT